MAITEEAPHVVRTPSHLERDSTTKPPLWRHLAWLTGIQTASMLALGVTAWLIHLFMSTAELGVPH